jgi:2-methylcitrate dehydratase PrpD
MSLGHPPKGFAGAIARFARGCTLDSVPEAAVVAAKSCLIDWAGVAIAAARDPASSGALLSTIADLGGPPQASVLGVGLRTSAANAAFANGALSHVLDLDDVHTGVRDQPVHVSAPIAPAVVAAAQWRRASGREALEAFVAGVETAFRLAKALGSGHYARGWHATSTVGGVAAALAAGRVLGLDEPSLEAAMGLAGVQASGFRGAFGTPAKACQVGHAAASGLLAAVLARNGVGTGGTDLFETAHGYFAVFATGGDASAGIDDLGSRFAVSSVTFKRHASCGATEAAIDAVLDMDARPAAADVESVVVTVPPAAADMARFEDPRTPLEAKFSITHCTALAFVVGSADLSQFEEDAFARDDVAALRRRIRVATEPGLSGARVEVRLVSGETAVATTRRDRWFERTARRHETVDAKFLALAAPSLSPERARKALGSLRALEDEDDLEAAVSLLQPPAPPEGPGDERTRGAASRLRPSE